MRKVLQVYRRDNSAPMNRAPLYRLIESRSKDGEDSAEVQVDRDTVFTRDAGYRSVWEVVKALDLILLYALHARASHTNADVAFEVGITAEHLGQKLAIPLIGLASGLLCARPKVEIPF